MKGYQVETERMKETNEVQLLLTLSEQSKIVMRKNFNGLISVLIPIPLYSKMLEGFRFV